MNTLTIAMKELKSYFVSPIAYVIIAFWLLATGLFFYLILVNVRTASLQELFGTVTVLLLLIGPALTMRLLSEEQRTGSLELLMTAPIRDWEVVLGKYLAAVLLFVAMMALTLIYPILMQLFGGTPDWGPIFSGYLGLLLFAAAFLAIGLFASALSDNQMLAAVIAFVILLILWMIGQLGTGLAGAVSGWLQALSVTDHFNNSFPRGVIDFTDVLFYLLIIGVSLWTTIQIMEAKRWRA
jgi:gliding motility-associated transport system permease protein